MLKIWNEDVVLAQHDAKVAAIAARPVRVDITRGAHGTRFEVSIPNDGIRSQTRAAHIAAAVEAGAKGHLTFFPPNVILAD